MYIDFLLAQKVAKIREKELALAQRIYDVKMRRVEEAQEKKARGSAVLQLERIYQTIQDLLQAKLVASEADSECQNAEANFLAQHCRVLRLEKS